MNGEPILACVIQFLVDCGCGAAFLAVGMWAKKSEKPMHFYSGTAVDPKSISDIPAYNAENCKMWLIYSVPYWFSGLCGIGGLLDGRFLYLALFSVVFACTFGVFWLVRRYHRILNRYKTGNT